MLMQHVHCQEKCSVRTGSWRHPFTGPQSPSVAAVQGSAAFAPCLQSFRPQSQLLLSCVPKRALGDHLGEARLQGLPALQAQVACSLPTPR